MELYEGMKVRVRHDLSKKHCGQGINGTMRSLRGTIVTIDSIPGDGSIFLVGVGFNWIGDCFVPIDVQIDDDGNII